MRQFFTSDWHIGHRNIIEYSKRPFSNIEEMTEQLIARFNAVVRPEDFVWHLGDFSLDEKRVAPVLARLVRCRHVLVMGNHDSCHPCHKRGKSRERVYLEAGFDAVAERIPNFGLRDTRDSRLVTLSHMPYVGDHTERERYTEFRPIDDGRWLLHGHVHEKWKTRGRMINVGCDVWDYRPVSATELLDLIESFESGTEGGA